MSRPGHLASDCCVPKRAGAPDAPGVAYGPDQNSRRGVSLPGGPFRMGTDYARGFAADGEGPVRKVALSPFEIDAFPVTNADFAAFVAETGYVTEAETFGTSFVFRGHLPDNLRAGGESPDAAPWWALIEGACWHRPEGAGSNIGTRCDHPVVHVSWNDASAFAAWCGMALPTEAQWEYAARGGLDQALYSWGDELTPDGRHMCNIWQGEFPAHNIEDDGYGGTCPVMAFPANGYGLYSMTGNTWEWCSDHWTAHFSDTPVIDPQGPAFGTGRVMKGGSFLCHDSYCNRYRVAARTHNTPGSSASNIGFRCVR